MEKRKKKMSKKVNNEKLTAVLEGILVIVLGILIAVVGIGETVDIYFGVLALVLGAASLGLAIYLLAKKGVMPLGMTLGAGALIAVGAGLFAKYTTFAFLVNFLVLVVMGVGAALMLYGIYFLIKVNKLYGVLQIVVGAGLVTLTAVYMTVPDFAKAFWIIVGIFIAVYGTLSVIFALVDKK